MSEILIVIFRLILLAALVICAIATVIAKKPLTSVIIFTSYSIVMSILWILLESPDLAITEAAVGAGVTGILFYLTLRRIGRIDRDREKKQEAEKKSGGEDK